jgi:serine/threonine protein kinase
MGCPDIFSLGVVLFEMLSGRRPSGRDSPRTTLSWIAQALSAKSWAGWVAILAL